MMLTELHYYSRNGSVAKAAAGRFSFIPNSWNSHVLADAYIGVRGRLNRKPRANASRNSGRAQQQARHEVNHGEIPTIAGRLGLPLRLRN